MYSSLKDDISYYTHAAVAQRKSVTLPM